MPDTTDSLRDLLAELTSPGGPAVFSSTLRVRPAGWPEHPVLRAAVYSNGAKTWGGGDGAGPVLSTIVRDGREIRLALVASVEARAHALTAALRQALEDAGAGVPLIELYADFDGETFTSLITDSWEVPHRVSDPYWREALWPELPKSRNDWPRFFKSETGKQLDPAKPFDTASLLRLYPTALLLGADPRAAILSAKSGQASRKGRKRKRSTAGGQARSDTDENARADDAGEPTPRSSVVPLGRLCRSEIVAEIGGLYRRTQSLRRPVPAMLDATIYQTPDGGWTVSEDEALKVDNKPVAYPGSNDSEGHPSAVGLDDLPASVRQVPDVYANTVIVSSYLSLAGIRSVRFPTLDVDGQAADGQAAARRLLAAMGIAAIIGAERQLRIRSGCDLVLDDGSDAITRTVRYAGLPSVGVELSYEDAVALLGEAAGAAKELGVWSPERIRLVAGRDLLKLIGREPGEA